VIPAGMRIWAAATPVDMRRGLVGLAELARQQSSVNGEPGGAAYIVLGASVANC
jgi:hypothetical protein